MCAPPRKQKKKGPITRGEKRTQKWVPEAEQKKQKRR